MKAKVTNRDIYQLYSLDELCYNSSGDKLSFSVKRADEFEDKYCRDIWFLDTATEDGKVRRLTSSGDIGAFIWESEDEIVFESGRNHPKAGVTDFFKISLSGAEAQKAFQINEKAKLIAKLSEGNYLVEILKATDPKQAAEDRAEEGKEFWTFTDYPFLHEGEGFGECRRKMLAVYNVEKETVSVITQKYFETAGYCLDQEKKKVLYFGETYFEHAKTGYHELLEYDILSGETRTLLPAGAYRISSALYTDNEIIVQASKRDSVKQPNFGLYKLDLEGLQLEEIMETDSVYREAAAARQNGILGVQAVKMSDELVHIQLRTKEITTLGTFDECTSAAENEDYIVAAAKKETGLPELYRINKKEQTEECLTQFGAEYAEVHEMVQPEMISFAASNGEEVEGMVIRPALYSPDRKYPGILFINGEMNGRVTKGYMHQMQMLASEGMFVFSCNPHGSEGYGKEFLKTQGHLGKTDYEQYMEFTDAVLEKFPQIEESCLGVTGIGYGGYMTNVIISKTDRFRAAVTQDGFCHMTSECLIAETGNALMERMFGDDTPWTNEKAYWEQSPLAHVKDMKTPLLFIHADQDHYCFWGEPMQLFTALKQCGTDTKFLLFYGDGHGLSGVRKPSNMVKRAEALAGWFKEHFKE